MFSIRIYTRIKDFLYKILYYIYNLPTNLSSIKRSLTIYLFKSNKKLKNLFQTNLSLGLYHLKNGEIKDAIFRFKIMKLLFPDKSSIIHYWLAWSYIILSKKDKLKNIIVTDTAFDLELKHFLSHYSKITIIPDVIYQNYRDFSSRYYHKKFLKEKIVYEFFLSNLSETLSYSVDQKIFKFIDFFGDRNQNSSSNHHIQQIKNWNVLEIFNSNGFLGKIIKKQFANIQSLDAFEISPQMHQISNLLEVYSKNYLINSLKNFSSELQNSSLKQSYKLVICFYGIGYIANLESIFSCLKHLLQDGGYFVFNIHLQETSYFSIEHFQFIYTEQYIVKLFTNFGFKLLTQHNIRNSNRFASLNMFIIEKLPTMQEIAYDRTELNRNLI